MRRAVWTTALSACMLPLLAGAARGQQADSGRSSMAGVYSETQAARGQDTYASLCQGCHTPGSHSGAAFLNAWRGRELWGLFVYIRDLMPKNDPGILTPGECAQLVAYLLKLNGMPAGAAELPADSAALSGIRLETTTSSARVPGHR